MITVGNALESIIESNPFLQTGMSEGLFNLSRLAEYLHLQVEARTKKEVSVAAIVMALSRLLKKRRKIHLFPHFGVDDVFVTANLCALTFPNTPQLRKILNSIHNKLLKQAGFITISHGIRELCIILPRHHVPLLKESVTEKPLNAHVHLAAVSISFKSDYQTTPGFFYSVFQQLYFQSINIIEISSTGHELIVFVDEKDARLVFDTLFSRFAC